MSFQNRITYTLGGFSLLMTILIGLSGHYINEQIESQIWRSTLQNEFVKYMANSEKYIDYVNNLSGNLKVYVVPTDQLDDKNIPGYIRHLSPGIYDEIEIDDRDFSILVKDVGADRVFLVFDISYMEQDEFNYEMLVLALVIISLLIIIILSRILGKFLVSPIQDMATRVSQLNPNERGLSIDGDYSDSELSVIAEAINSYLEKLDSFLDREKEFIDTASHELRTPITIISGAVDILNSQPHTSEVTARAAMRIKHATKDIAESINALFILAKNDSQLAGSAKLIHLDDLVNRIIEEQVAIFPDKKAIINRELDKTCIMSPIEATSIVLRNLVRNALEHSENEHIDIRLEKGVFEIKNQWESMTPEDIALLFNKRVRGKSGKGNGLGLYLIKRICECLNWELDTSGIVDNQFSIKMDLSRNYVPCDQVNTKKQEQE